MFEQRGEFSAAVELRQRTPASPTTRRRRECARTIASWKPLPLRPVKRMPKAPRAERRGRGVGTRDRERGYGLSALGRRISCVIWVDVDQAAIDPSPATLSLHALHIEFRFRSEELKRATAPQARTPEDAGKNFWRVRELVRECGPAAVGALDFHGG